MLKQLWNDEAGVIISAELVLVLTIGVLMLVVGLHAVVKSVNYELGDIASAFGSIEQSFSYDGFANGGGVCNNHHAEVKGSAYTDEADDCDCSEIVETQPVPKADGSPRNVPENT